MIVPIVALILLGGMHLATMLELRRQRRERAADRRDRKRHTSEAVREALIAINEDPEYWHDEREVTGTISAEQHSDRRWWLESNLLVRKHRQKPPPG